MPLFDSIVCAVDFSDQSREALHWALALSAAEGASVSVVNVVDPILARAALVQYDIDLVTKETDPELGALVSKAAERASYAAPIRRRVVVGDAAERIIAFAHEARADLIVMGTQGLGGARKLLLGSTTERVLKRTDVDVLAIPPPPDRQLVVFDRDRPHFRLSRIVAAVDFTDASIAAAQVGVGLAALFHVPLTVAHVVPVVHTLPRWATVLENYEETRTAEARAQLAHVVEGLGAADALLVVLSGPPADRIIDLTGAGHDTLVTMGLKSHGHLLGPVPGSIAYRVLSRARVPVLVVPPEAGLARKARAATAAPE